MTLDPQIRDVGVEEATGLAPYFGLMWWALSGFLLTRATMTQALRKIIKRRHFPLEVMLTRVQRYARRAFVCGIPNWTRCVERLPPEHPRSG